MSNGKYPLTCDECVYYAGVYCELHQNGLLYNSLACGDYEPTQNVDCPFCNRTGIFTITSTREEVCSFCNGKGTVNV